MGSTISGLVLVELIFSHMLRALYDYVAEQEGDISFEAGDLITVASSQDDWWYGTRDRDGLYGSFPSNFVQVIYLEDETSQDQFYEEECHQGDIMAKLSGILTPNHTVKTELKLARNNACLISAPAGGEEQETNGNGRLPLLVLDLYCLDISYSMSLSSHFFGLLGRSKLDVAKDIISP